MNREAEILEHIEELKQELEEVRKRKTLLCPHCNVRSGLQKFTLIYEVSLHTSVQLHGW